MELFEAIAARYSYRGEYQNQPVPRKDLEQIVTAGIQAPSGVNAQSTEFLIVDDAGLLEKMGLLIKNKSMANCPAAIVILCNEEPVYNNKSFYREDYGAAVENILLAMTALGYAGVWIDGALKRNDIYKKVARLLHVPDNRSLQVVIPVGVPVNPGKQNSRKPFNERAWFNRYKG